MNTYIARQPIFDRSRKVAGYELLYRDARGRNAASFSDGDAATRGVLSDAVTVFGIPQLTNKLPAYINFTRNLILDDFALLADPKEIVIELLGDVAVDEQLADKLRALKKAGYRLALKDYDGSARFNRVKQLFNVVRVDFSVGNELQKREIIRKVDYAGVQLLAEKVETQEDFDSARQMGFSLFQGYFFEKPTLVTKQSSLTASSYGKLFNVLLKPEVDFDACCRLIENDPVLTYMFLRQVQTANYYRGNRITDVKRGLLMMGTEELRRWVSLVLLKKNNVSQSDELARKSYLRGRFVEKLIENSKTKADSRQGFLLGLFSLLDRVMGVEMDRLLYGLEIDSAVKAALLGEEENEYSLFLNFATIYDMGNTRMILPELPLRISDEEVSTLYMKCVELTDAAFEDGEGAI